MLSRVTTTFTRTCRGFRSLAKSVCAALLALVALLVTSAPVLAQEESSAWGLNAWWLFLGILTVLASGLYIQSTRRRSG